METHNIHNPVIGSRNHRVNLHAHNYRRHMKAGNVRESYNHKGAGSVTVLLAITTVSFIFYYVLGVLF
jgi:hypothetical protein